MSEANSPSGRSPYSTRVKVIKFLGVYLWAALQDLLLLDSFAPAL